MVLGRILGILGRSSYSKTPHGLLTLLRSNRDAPTFTARYSRGVIPFTASGIDIVDDRPYSATSDYVAKATHTTRRNTSKVYEARRKAAIKFEKEHANSIRDYNFKLGDLVLMRNMAIKKALNKKMKLRYLGPLIVISKNKGGAYIIAELDGTLFDRPIAAFRLVPYFARKRIPLPPLKDLLDISKERLDELRKSTSADLDELLDDGDFDAGEA